ncbi:MAG TPA: helix-turn-helix domain-containing protein, partial [Bacteroidales bacterium]|nr:helix-turn-helix domain-containing protein [Bacteroidales bacterium]
MKKLKKVIKLISDEAPLGTICFPHYTYNVIAFIEVEDEFAAKPFAEKIHGKIRQDTGMLSTIGISNRHEGIKNMPLAFTESEQALSASVLLGRNRCIAHDEYQSILNKNQSSRDIDWDDFIFSIENGLEDKVHEHISQYVGLIRGSKVTDIEYYRLMTMDMLSKSATTLNKYGSGFNQITGEDHLYSEIRSINVVDEIEPYLVQSIRKVMDFHMKKKSRRGRKVVEDALLFVNQEIYSPDLSLKTVAAKIYSNESYLSRVFKKEMNISLIEYIMKKRIEESISLLNSTDLKVYEIAEKIGFRDPHYFSICFKKITGVTVKEFKKLNTSK